MKELKPSRIEENEEPKKEEFVLSPQRVEGDFKEIEEEEKIRKKSKKSFLIVAFILSFLLFFAIESIYDIIKNFRSVLNDSLFLGTLYIASFAIFIAIFLYFIFKQYKGYSRLKNIENLRQKAKELKENPSPEVFHFAKEILSTYKNHIDENIRKNASTLEKELQEGTILQEEVLDAIEERIFAPLDKKAYEIISKYSTQTALSTAISPVALIDMILILSRSWAMITSIAELYGYKPNLTGKIVLLKRVSFNLIFASITDLASDYLSSVLGTSVLSKLSYHSAQGLANGILTARVGVATIYACRTFYLKERINYVKYIAKKLLETLLGKTQAV